MRRLLKTEFFRNLFTLVSATSLAQGIALAVYPLLSRIYTPAEHGLFALFMSIISVTAIMSTGKFELAVMIPKSRKEGISLVLNGILLSFLVSIILLIVLLFAANPISQRLGNPGISRWLYFVPLSTFLVGAFQSLSYWHNRNKKYRRIASANLGQSLVNSTVKLSTSNALAGGGGLILGAIAGQISGLVIMVRRFFTFNSKLIREIRLQDLLTTARKHSYFPRYNMPHYLVNNFSSSLPVFMFSYWFSPEVVGFYSLGFMMVNRPMNLITGSLTQVFSQRIIQKYNHGEVIIREVKMLVWRLFFLAILPFTLMAFFSPVVFSFVFGEEWLEAGKYTRILLPWLFVVFLSSPLSFLPDLLSRQKKAMWIDVIKFFMRIIALGIGLIMNDIYLALILFSGISFLLVSYNLFWYVNLSAQQENRSS